jgi:DNA segregation ATPase FtsK/SpoIIIE-like protein
VDPGTALYPVIREAHGVYANLNAPGTQPLAVLASASRRRPTAAMIGRVLDAPVSSAAPQIAAPAEHYPARVDVYSAPMPKRLALPIGVAGDGRHVALPLRGMGNVVIGGLPNCGKSELLASMAAGLLRQDATGERQQIAVVDMKLVSFGNLPDLAALRWPVATEIDEAHQVIAAARAECSRRYMALKDARARTLEEYQDVTGEPLPYLTVLVDEIADLTQDDDRGRRDRFLASAMEIARKGRAAGVGLVMATQRPSADVLPSSLRNLAGAAVAFRVQRNHDSIAVLGEPGAETLPAVPGRCLVRHSATVQVQAFYAGLEGGRFDAFVAQLPTGDALPAPTWPVRYTDTAPVYQASPASMNGIPVFSTDDRAAYTPEQIAHIRDRYAALGSLKAVERELYAQDGGYWFYRLKEVLQ